MHGDIDVFMSESFDEGAIWTSGIRINDDPIANNRMQDLLWADFDVNGNLVVSCIRRLRNNFIAPFYVFETCF